MLTLACGACFDGNLTSVLPFVYYWFILWLAWSFLWGIPASVASLRSTHSMAMRPLVYFGGGLLAVITAGMFTMGSLFAGMVFYLPWWLHRLYKRNPLEGFEEEGPQPADTSDPPEAPRPVPRLARAENLVRRCLLGACLGLIPVSYLRLYFLLEPVGMWPPWR